MLVVEIYKYWCGFGNYHLAFSSEDVPCSAFRERKVYPCSVEDRRTIELKADALVDRLNEGQMTFNQLPETL